MQYSFRHPALADALWPGRSLVRQAALVVLFSLAIAATAQLAIPLPFTPVPITGQTLAVLLTGLLLGSRLGAIAVLAYLAEGLAGLPFFAAGRAGPAVLLGPTGGYLLGFVVAAFVVGLLAERGWDRRPWTTALAMAAGNLLIYAAGLPWLASFVGPERAVAAGLLPFLPGDVLKLLLATALLPTCWKLLGRSQP